MNDRVELLGCRFDRVTLSSAVERCIGWCLGPRAPHTVITVNAAIICMMRRDRELRDACLQGDLVVPDGAPLVWTSRLAGLPFPERVAGVDLMTRLLQEASRHRLRVFFLGARREVVDRLVRRCAEETPELVVAGHRDGYFSPAEHEAVVEEVRRASAHLLFVGMPSPFKETWCQRHRVALDVPVVVGVGGSFDVLSGHVRRAPRFVQAMGLEWSWRLALEPRRLWKRYLLTNSEYLALAAVEVLRRRVGLSRQGASPGRTSG